MNSKKPIEVNLVWEDIRGRTICDRWGNDCTTTSYSASNHFRIDPHIDYQYMLEEEVAKERLLEEQKDEARCKEQEEVLAYIYKFAEKHFTPAQKDVFSSFLAGKRWTDIADERNCTEAAVRQVFFGNSKKQGGIIRKLKKCLRKTTSNNAIYRAS